MNTSSGILFEDILKCKDPDSGEAEDTAISSPVISISCGLREVANDEYIEMSDELVRRVAGSHGEFEAVFPQPNELQLDIDSEEDYARFERVFYLLVALTDADIGCKTAPSKSGLPRRHVTISLPFTVTDVERILLQACLGSDGRRELYGFRRWLAGDPQPTVFIEKRSNT